MTTASAWPAREPDPDRRVVLLRLRCPEHRRNPRGNKWTRPGVRCEACRTVWAYGEGPDAVRDQDCGGPPEPWDVQPPV